MPGSMPLTDERSLTSGAITNPVFAARALPAATARSTRLPSPWVRGPAWDGFWMLSALWLAPIILWLCHGYSNPQDSPLDLLYFGLTALFWIGHRLSSTYLAYFTEAYRPLLRSQPVRFVVIPLFVTAGCFAVFLPSDAALPWSRAGTFGGARHHRLHLCHVSFCRAAFRRARSLPRAGRPRRLPVTRERWIGSSRSASAACSFSWPTSSPARSLIRITGSIAGSFPTFLVSAQDEIRAGATVVLLVATAAMLFVELRSPRWSLPRVLYVLGIAAMVAMALRPRSLFLFLVIWTSQHWILATGLASQTPTAEPAPGRGLARRMLHALNTRPWAILILLGLVSVALMPLFEIEANRQDGTFYGDRIFGAFAEGLRTSSWVPALLALGSRPGSSTISSTGVFIECQIHRFARRRKVCSREPTKDERETTIRFAQEICDQTGRLIAMHEKFPVDSGHRIA